MLKALLGIAAAALLLSGCHFGAVATGETRRDTKSIELDNAEVARVDIRMGAGEMRVKSGTPKLLEAEFAYNVPEWKPVVDYRGGPSGGNLTISQPRSSGVRMGKTVYTWDLNLNGQLPMEITANLGAGEANLELGRMNLRSVEVNVGAGKLKVDLRGAPSRDYHVQIQGGVGEATVYVPKDVAISATAAGAIGQISAAGLEKRDGVWINPERIHAPVTVRLDVKGGVGKIRLVR